MLLIYTRVSTVEQAAENRTSMEEQERIGRGFAMSKGFSQFDTAIYADPGISASIALRDRPDGKRLLEDAKSGDTIFASKFDRLFRSARDALNMAEIFKEKGIKLVLFNFGTEPVNGNGIGEFFFTIIAAVAQLERTLIRERMTDGKKAKIAKGGHVGGKAPYGFRIVGHGRAAQLEPIAEEQKVIDTLRAWKKEYEFLGVASTMRALTECGMVSRNGKPFQKMQVARLIKQVDDEQFRLRKGLPGKMSALPGGVEASLSA